MNDQKRIYEKSSERQKLRYLRALESNNMNQSLTARELGISRSTVARYYKQYWSEYLQNKPAVFEESKNIARKKMILDADLENISVKLRTTFLKSLNLMGERLKNDPASIKTKDLIQFIAIAAPYLMEKLAVAGAKEIPPIKEESIMTTHSKFVEQITNHIRAKKAAGAPSKGFNDST
ncbi:helix-turn-helix domain-containing protein [Maribellus sp. YY47]|uniref:helix-turn-helix domain-containing protein n=1 Tax=Maribellus sp. YY47 TaxID=2929486 RepID=UPI0020007EA5|nr:helix-turn-helix domain-containing protein [Maribellus sp. YY47]MCK3684376.1 hypothetical protein [Maribellus sp. YY47]